MLASDGATPNEYIHLPILLRVHNAGNRHWHVLPACATPVHQAFAGIVKQGRLIDPLNLQPRVDHSYIWELAWKLILSGALLDAVVDGGLRHLDFA